ncbi:MAG: hypothetical protein GDA56_00750 [Hormoscilla sp. GM7CHS1pb]|nr:hypothetical protein [Hormoscilla sp. GM7CHS1pb]
MTRTYQPVAVCGESRKHGPNGRIGKRFPVRPLPAGIISPIVAVLTFLEIKPFQTQQKTTLPSPEQTPSQPKSETLPNKLPPTQE